MDIKQQTQNVANQGRYGDSMLLHVNPAEVKGLASALPLTVNPQTGQPEAFLPFLAPLAGSLLGGSLLGGALGSTLLGSAVGSGLAQYAATGDLKKGLLAGLTGYGVGTALQTASGAAGASAATQAATDAATTAGTLGDVATQKLIQSAGTQAGGEALKTASTLAPATATTAATGTPFANLKSIFNPAAISPTTAATAPDLLTAGTTVDPTLGTSFKNLATGLTDPMAYIPAGVGMGGTGIMESQEAFERMLGESAEAYRRRREAMYRNTPEPTLYSGGGAIRGFNGEDDSYTGGDLPQIFAPARAAYDVNPNFMAGFNPETMYFNPATIAAPASSLSANSAPPVLEDTYTGTKGGYGGDPLVISPEGRQASIDPFTAYTGEAPAGLVPYSTTQPAPYIDITGDDLGLPDGGGEYVFDDIQTLDDKEQEGVDDFTFDIDDYLNNLDLSNINVMGQNYDFSNFDLTRFLNEYDPSSEVFSAGNKNLDFSNYQLLDDNLFQIKDEGVIDTSESYNTSIDDLLNLQNNLNMNMGVDSFVENEGTQNSNTALDDLLALDNIVNLDTGVDSFVENEGTQNSNTALDDLLALENSMNMNTGVDTFVENEGTQTSNVVLDDLLALENSMNMNTGVDTFTTADNTFNNNLNNTNNVTDLLALDPFNTVDTLDAINNTFNNTLDLSALDTLNALDTTTNLGMTDTLDTTTLAALDSLYAGGPDSFTETLDTFNTAPLDVFDSINTLGLTDNTLNTSKMNKLTMAEGGQLPNKGLEALNKVAPDVVDKMGYQEGGITDMQSDPLTQEVTMFILGETDNEQALNEFITKYGSDAFMQLREAVLQSIVPNAQTEGLIRGNGEGGMDDDLRGMIGSKERIAVSQDEFIVPADVVSMLGDGSSDAGSKELYDMMDRVRKEKTGTTKQAPRLANAGGLLPA